MLVSCVPCFQTLDELITTHMVEMTTCLSLGVVE